MQQPYLLGLCGLAGSGKDTVADRLVSHHNYVKVSFADPLKRICKEVFEFSDEQLWGPSEKRNAADYRYPRTVKEYLDEKTGEPIKVREDFLTPRFALQLLGTEWGRQCYQGVWVEYALRVARKIMEEGCTYSVMGGLTQPDTESLSTAVFDLLSRRGVTVDKHRVDNLVKCSKPQGVVIADVRFKNEIAALKAAGGRVIRVRPPEQKALAEWQMHPSEMEQFTMKDEDFDAVIINPKVSFETLYRDVDALMKSLEADARINHIEGV
jgi:hypothetical protein